MVRLDYFKGKGLNLAIKQAGMYAHGKETRTE